MDYHIGNYSMEYEPPPKKYDKTNLREWWFEILRRHYFYRCFGIFLLLPSDLEAINYLTQFGKELDLLSGETCLLIILSKDTFAGSMLNTEIQKISQNAIEEQVSKGYSIDVAKLFGIKFAEFPCLLLFRDIRSSEHALITLNGMTSEEIAHEMRSVFDIIGKNPIDPIKSLNLDENKNKLKKGGQNLLIKAGNLAEKTFAIAIEAWLNSLVK